VQIAVFCWLSAKRGLESRCSPAWILCGCKRVAAFQGRQEVTMGEIQCPRCERVFNTRLDAMRFRSGSFYDADREESFDQLCEDCHRAVVKDQ